MPDDLSPSSDFFTDVRSILADARRAAYTAVNSAMVAAYWQIGRRIVEEDQGGSAKSTYGDRLLPELSRALTAEFGKGFSLANLKNFRQFYLTYPDPEICYALRSKLSWTHHRLIMRVESPSVREYYITHAERENWSTRTLERQIETRSYQRLLSSQDTACVPASPQSTPSIRDFIKDPYVLEFLGLPEDPAASETEVESAIISQLQSFLLEMGHGFSFVARQMRVRTETSHFYLDLVFYHYVLANPAEAPPLMGLLLVAVSPVLYSIWIIIAARLSGERSRAEQNEPGTVPPYDSEVAAEERDEAHAGPTAAIMLSATAVAWWIAALATSRPVLPAQIPGEAWVGLVGIGVIAGAVAVQAFYAGARRIGAAQASLVSTIEPVYTITLAALLLGEALTPIQLLGGLLVIIGVVIAQARS